MASQRQHRSRLAGRLGKLRRVLAQVSVFAGAAIGLAAAAPVNASVQLDRHALDARVLAVRSTLRDAAASGEPGSTPGDTLAVRTAQWFNWGNWNNWNNWKNWLNK